jgi:hypothetical protein
MITNGRVREKEPNVATSMSELTHDVIELAELQAQLLTLDLKSVTRQSRTSILLSVVGICLLVGTVPDLLLAIGEYFVEQHGWTHAAGYGLAAAISILASAVLLGLGWNRFQSGLKSLHRSRDELRRNIAWIKSSLRNRQHAQPAEAD